MKILILSFYYPPDLNPGSFRSDSLVKALRRQYNSDIHITVIASSPNRYRTHTPEEAEEESANADRLIRLTVKPHQSGLFDQAIAYRSFFFGAIRKTKGEKYDIIYATTSRLMTGFTASLIARRSKTPLYLDIRDLFLDTMGDLLKGSLLRFTLPVFRIAEHFTFSTARKISVVSEAFIPYLYKKGVKSAISFFPNGIDPLFIDSNPPSSTKKNINGKSKLKQMVYIGNIGEGQGLEKILPQAAKQVEEEWEFLLIGYGGAIGKLKRRIEELEVKNIRFHDPVPRTKVPAFYTHADALFLHLNNVSAFERVIPSKIFEYAAAGKPIIAGISGYPARFCVDNIPDVKLFNSCDVTALVQILKQNNLEVDMDLRKSFIEQFRREKIMDKVAQDLITISKEI